MSAERGDDGQSGVREVGVVESKTYPRKRAPGEWHSGQSSKAIDSRCRAEHRLVRQGSPCHVPAAIKEPPEAR